MILAGIIGPIFLVYGLSVLIHAKQWGKLTASIKKDHCAVFPVAMMSLIFGLILVNAYNIWDWNAFLIITLTGWVLLAKGIFYFLAPESWNRAILRWKWLSHVSYRHFSGAAIATLGATLVYYGYWPK